jgi:flagellar hook-length control protein FliK
LVSDNQPVEPAESINSSADAAENEDSSGSRDSIEHDEAIEGPIDAPLVVDPQNPSILRNDRRDASKRGAPGSEPDTSNRSPQPTSNLESEQIQGQYMQSGLENHDSSSLMTDLNASSKGRHALKEAGDHADIVPKAGEANIQPADAARSALDAVKAVPDSLEESDRSKFATSIDDRPRLTGSQKQEDTVAGGDDGAFANPIDPKDAAQESSKSRRRNDRSNNRTRIGGGQAGDESVAGERPERANHGRSDVQSASAMTHHASEQAKAESASLATPITASAGMSSGQSTVPSTSVVPSMLPNTPGTSFNPSTTSKTRNVTSSTSLDSWTGTTTTTLPSTAPASPTSDVRSNPGASGASGTNLSRYQETKLVQRVLRGMEQLANGGGQVRLRLHPPELGALQMSLRIEGQVMTADMQVETSGARDALMKNLPLLKERLAEQGMLVEHFDVRTDSSSTPGGSGASSWENPQRNESQSERGESRSHENANGRQLDGALGSGPVDETPKRWTRTNGLIDVKA